MLNYEKGTRNAYKMFLEINDKKYTSSFLIHDQLMYFYNFDIYEYNNQHRDIAPQKPKFCDHVIHLYEFQSE